MKHLKPLKSFEDLGFDVEPKGVPLKAWLLFIESEDGSYSIQFHSSKPQAEQAYDESGGDESENIFIVEQDFKMELSNGEWYIEKGYIESGGHDHGY